MSIDRNSKVWVLDIGIFCFNFMIFIPFLEISIGAGQSILRHHHVLTVMRINMPRSMKLSVLIKMNHAREF